MLDQSYLKYGLTQGVLKVGESMEKGEGCIMLAWEWPSWAFALRAEGFQVKPIVLMKDTWKA